MKHLRQFDLTANPKAIQGKRWLAFALSAIGSLLLLCLTVSPVYADDPIGLNPVANWSSKDDNAWTYSVAWGDMDGDGDLDLAVGNSSTGDSNRVYLNEQGTLQRSAAWESDDKDHTWSVAWGDVDSDGDLDLAAGSYNKPNKVYLNERGMLQPTAVWTDTVNDDTNSIAWGDVNGDGYLDLAVGNWDKPNKVYLNDKGELQTTAVWTGTVSDYTLSVAWGDIDSDGDLDLAVGNSRSNKIYLNEKGVLTTTAVWTDTVLGDITESVAWGDVDSNGYPDLAVGNRGRPNKVYLNQGGVLQTNAVWTDTFDDHTISVAWGDVDGDGDLDLAVGNKERDEPNKVYLNEEGVLTTTVTWESDDEDNTWSVAWGDVDGDGDLDLAVGNVSGPNKIYPNEGGMLQTTAVWTDTISDHTRCVAWGDVDTNGNLDLAVGNGIENNKIYSNKGQVLQTIPVWTDDVTDSTKSVAWGDIDGDGDLDLAIGNEGESNKIYLNQGGILQITAAWTETVTDVTFSVAWGDVDNDGDLDLVVGNCGEPNKVYPNDGGMLQTAAAWESGDNDCTKSVAWGDMDSDGDLDLAVGNEDEPNKVYLNQGGTLQPSPVWESSDIDYSLSVAWGDVDSDGDLDLASGNVGGPNKIYLNEGGTLQTTAAWESSDSDYTYSVAWGDVDGEGDLDLAAGNTYAPNKVYLNKDGVLQATASWESSNSDYTESVAWGDMDADGDLDLVAGNGEGSNKVYLNQQPSHPLRPGYAASVALGLSSDPVQTFSSQMVTTLAPANFYAVPGIRQTGAIPFTYTLFNPTGNPMHSVRAFYSPDGGGRWHTAAAASGTMTTNLSAGGAGTYAAHTSLPHPIPDQNTISVTLMVTEPHEIADLDIWLTITHTHDADIDVCLRSPAGTQIELFTDVGGDGDNFEQTWFSDQATMPITSGTAPFTDTYRPEDSLADFNGEISKGMWTLIVTDDTGGNIGALAKWGLRIQEPPVPHTYTWDVFASGFFGQSDNVVFRLEVSPLPSHSSVTGTYRYTNAIPGPYQRPYVSAHTFPFRVRGSQVRVLSGMVPVSNALVYRLPEGRSSGAEPFASGAGLPFRTDSQGYLQGRGELNIGDRLVALLPITATDSYVLYHTNAKPTLTGLEAYTVTALGVQTLTVSSANPLVLFNLDVSLEWDARKDTAFLEQLEFDLLRTSEALYDWTNGQAALGEVIVYHDREHWNDAHIRIYASNRMRPNAVQGGITSQVITDPLTSTIAYAPGQVRMGAVWNRYGDPSGNPGEDWPRTLAHELGHYAFFLNDNYLGLDAKGQLIPVDTCTGTAMSDPYRDDYSEFHLDDEWLPGCERTLSHQITGRSDWATINAFYPWLNDTITNIGPSILPLAVTQIHFTKLDALSTTLDSPTFYLTQKGSRIRPGNSAQAFLFQGDWLTDLGRPTLDRVLARGARPGDRVCVYDLAEERLGCEQVEASGEQLALISVPGWDPDVIISPITSRMVEITVSTTLTDSLLKAQLFPIDGWASDPIPLAHEQGSGVHTGIFSLTEEVLEGYVHIWVTGDEYIQEIVTGYALGGGPAKWHGTCAPAISADGQVLLFGKNITFDEGEFFTLQTATTIPMVPSWATVVGQAYRLAATPSAPSLNDISISFNYMGNEVPAGEEDWLRVYFWDGGDWQQLSTELETYHNMASAPTQGPGLYALMSSVEIPLYGPGWNNFAYPVQETRPVTEALLSISGYYSTVYGYDTTDENDPWKVYDTTVTETLYLTTVNDLKELKFGRGYWISVTDAITLMLKGASDPDQAASLARAGDMGSPPSTYYGRVGRDSAFTPTTEMTVTAWIEGKQCGQGRIVKVDSELIYSINVFADGPGGFSGCGSQGDSVTFKVGSRTMAPSAVWNNHRLWELSLSPASLQFVYLPLILRNYEPVQVDFTASPLTGKVPLTVTFTNKSTGPYISSLWDFGDGVTSTLENPTHTYTATGAYTVTLSVSGPSGSNDEVKPNYITVYTTPLQAGFVATPTTGTAPLTVTFTNESIGAYTSSLWRFGDGFTSTLQNPVYTYNTPGDYTVTLTISGTGGTDTLTRTHYITILYTGCPGNIVVNGDFEQGSAGWYTFTTGEGPKAHDLIGSDAEGFYPFYGHYAARLGGYEGVQDIITQTVVIPPGGQFSYWWRMHTYETLPHHDTLSVELLESDGTRAALLSHRDDQDAQNIWQRDSADVSEYAGESLTLRISSYNDNYYFTTFDVDEICITTTTSLNADFTASPLTGTAPLTVTFTNESTGAYTSSLWDFGDGSTVSEAALTTGGFTSTLENPTHTYTATGAYTVTLVISGPGGTSVVSRTNYISVHASFAAQVVDIVNAQRAQEGCPALIVDPRLVEAADGHSEDMALNDFVSHTGSDGCSPADRIEAAGYQWLVWAENIASGYSTPEDVVAGWMESTGHRENILNCDLEDTGVGYYYLSDDPGDEVWHHYWTQVFAVLKSSSRTGPISYSASRRGGPVQAYH